MPPILSSNLKKKRDEILAENHMKNQSRSQSKNPNEDRNPHSRLVYCDSENVVQIFMPASVIDDDHINEERRNI